MATPDRAKPPGSGESVGTDVILQRLKATRISPLTALRGGNWRRLAADERRGVLLQWWADAIEGTKLFCAHKFFCVKFVSPAFIRANLTRAFEEAMATHNSPLGGLFNDKETRGKLLVFFQGAQSFQSECHMDLRQCYRVDLNVCQCWQIWLGAFFSRGGGGSIGRKTHTDVQLEAGACGLGSCLRRPTLFAEQQRLPLATLSTPVSRSLLLGDQQNASQTKQCPHHQRYRPHPHALHLIRS